MPGATAWDSFLSTLCLAACLLVIPCHLFKSANVTIMTRRELGLAHERIRGWPTPLTVPLPLAPHAYAPDLCIMCRRYRTFAGHVFP